MWIFILQRLSIEFVWHLVYFPLWWYSRGLKHAAIAMRNFISLGNATLAPGLWLQNIFVPMFGQHDWQGRLVSFFVRLVNVLVRGLLFLMWTFLGCAVFLIWPLLPVIVLFMMYFAVV